MRKKVFISYYDKDKEKLRALEKIVKGTKFLCPIIVANNREAIEQLSDKVKKGIIDCDLFVPILTRSSITSQWVNQEIGFAIALSREVIPIVELKIIDQDQLKGFIHKQLDLPYAFKGNQRNVSTEAKSFLKVAKLLVNDILLRNNIIPKGITMESLFPGRWKSTFILPNGQHGSDEAIEIKDDKYYINGKYWFDLKDAKIDLRNKKLQFKKIGQSGDDREILNVLKIVELGQKYTGKENGMIPITYIRID